MKKLRVLLVVVLFILLTVSAAFAYQAALKADASKPEVAKGETFTYTLSITEEGDADRPAALKPPDFGVFRVSGTFSSSNVKVIQGKARRVTEQVYRLSTDKPGKYVIPPAVLVLTDPATGKAQEMASDEVPVTVLAEPRGTFQGLEEDIKDIKEPKTFLDRIKLYFYALFALAVLALLILVGFAFYVVSKKKAKVVPSPALAVPGLSPRDEALRAIAGAETFRADTARYYTAVSDAVRKYLSSVHGIQAMEATTTEIMVQAKKLHVPPESTERLGSLLMEADMVKFAKYAPDEPGKTAFSEKAKRIVSEM